MKSDLVCEVVSETVSACTYTDPSPSWVYPVVIAVFVIALAILVLVAWMTFHSPDDNKGQNHGRRYDDYQDQKSVKIETDEPIKVEQVD